MSLNMCVCVCVYLYIYVYMLLRVFFVTSLVAQLVKNPPTRQEIPVWFLGQEDPWRKIGYTLIFLGFHGGSDSKESSCNSGDPGLIPGLGRSPREGNDYLLQYSCLDNSMDSGAGGLQSFLGFQRAREDWATNTFTFTYLLYSALTDFATPKHKDLPWGKKNIALGFPDGPVVKNPPCNARDNSSTHGPGRSHVPWGSCVHRHKYWGPPP